MTAARGTQGAWLAMAGALILVSVHVAGKAVRDTLFLSFFDITSLPKVMVGAAAASFLAAALVSLFLHRLNPGRAVPVAMALSGSLLFAEWRLVEAIPRAGAIAIYLHLSSLSLVLFSGFWSVVNERFDPYSAKEVVARVSGFGALGGVLGGSVAVQVADRFEPEDLLPGFALLHVVVAIVVWQLGSALRRAPPPVETDSEPSGVLGDLAGLPLVLKMALLLGAVEGTEKLVDYAFKATAVETWDTEAELLRFFALFYTATSVLAFALQTSVGPRLLRWLGVGGGLAVMPAAVAIASGGAALFQQIWTVSIARGANSVMASSLFKASFELLWTPIPNATRRRSKVIVDVGASGLGELAGSGLLLILVSWIAGVPDPVLLGLAAAISCGSLALVLRLHRGYVEQLAENLRTGAARVAGSAAGAATGAEPDLGARVTVDRAELLARIHELDGVQARTDPDEPDGEVGDGGEHRLLDPAIVADLQSTDAARVRAALEGHPMSVPLAGHVIPLLARPALVEDALAYLRDLAPRIVGQLGDALLDPESPLLVRRRIPRAMENAPGPRAIDLLTLGLADPDFEVQLECVRAMLLVIEQTERQVRTQTALAIVERTLAVDDRTWEQRGRRRGDSRDESVLLGPGELALVDRNLELIFTVLAGAYGRDEMASALRAIHSGNPELRGTALEYLQTLMPERIYGVLFARLPGGGGAYVARRRSDELAEALKQTAAPIADPGRTRRDASD